MLHLPSVTLVAVNGTSKLGGIESALSLSKAGIEFAEVLLLSPIPPKMLLGAIKHIAIEPMTWVEYNKFILKDLRKYIYTDHCLIVQDDGFVINPHLWMDEFLQYDYIGACWDFEKYPWQTNKVAPEVLAKGVTNLNRVGNGGFSLRSHKMLELTALCPSPCEDAEDIYICNNNYDFFVKNGMRFAPPTLADIFSKDPLEDFTTSFGFHGDKTILTSPKFYNLKYS